jgi:hypothetical protein
LNPEEHLEYDEPSGAPARPERVRNESLGEMPGGLALSAEGADDFDSDGHEGLLSTVG